MEETEIENCCSKLERILEELKLPSSELETSEIYDIITCLYLFHPSYIQDYLREKYGTKGF